MIKTWNFSLNPVKHTHIFPPLSFLPCVAIRRVKKFIQPREGENSRDISSAY